MKIAVPAGLDGIGTEIVAQAVTRFHMSLPGDGIGTEIGGCSSI
jgi:isocitrate/isopropylmalate dehydrogenase